MRTLGSEPVTRLGSRPPFDRQPEQLTGAAGADPACTGTERDHDTNVIGVDVAKDSIDARARRQGSNASRWSRGRCAASPRRTAEAEALVVVRGDVAATTGRSRRRSQAAGARPTPASTRPRRASSPAPSGRGQDRPGRRARARRNGNAGSISRRPRRCRRRGAPLQALATRRRQLVEMRKQELTRLQQTHDPFARRSIVRVIALLDREIAALRRRDRRQPRRRS